MKRSLAVKMLNDCKPVRVVLSFLPSLEWVGGSFDAEHNDLSETNELLREYCD